MPRGGRENKAKRREKAVGGRRREREKDYSQRAAAVQRHSRGRAEGDERVAAGE